MNIELTRDDWLEGRYLAIVLKVPTLLDSAEDRATLGSLDRLASVAQVVLAGDGRSLGLTQLMESLTDEVAVEALSQGWIAAGDRSIDELLEDARIYRRDLAVRASRRRVDQLRGRLRQSDLSAVERDLILKELATSRELTPTPQLT